MQSILPVSDLKNDIEDYENYTAQKKLFQKIREANQAVQDENNWLSLDELKAAMGD